MAVIVEDGTIVANANSYVTRAEYIDQAALIGVVVADDAIADQELIKAAQYLDSLDGQMIGSRVDRDQPLAFPRAGFVQDGFVWGSAEIPWIVKRAQVAVAIDIRAGADPYNPEYAQPPRIRERVEGAVEVEYAEPEAYAVRVKTQSGSLVRKLLRMAAVRSIPLVRA